MEHHFFPPWMPPETIDEKTRRSYKNKKQISSVMIQIQKPISAVAEESLCEHSVASISNHSSSQESGTGEGTETGHSTMTSSLNNGDIKKVKFIQVEELNVRRARRLVSVVFVLCAVAVSIAVFFFAKRSDERAFEVEVRKNAATPFHSLRIAMKRMATNTRYHCAAFLAINHSSTDSSRTSWTSYIGRSDTTSL
jgi:hypothetical protein